MSSSSSKSHRRDRKSRSKSRSRSRSRERSHRKPGSRGESHVSFSNTGEANGSTIQVAGIPMQAQMQGMCYEKDPCGGYDDRMMKRKKKEMQEYIKSFKKCRDLAKKRQKSEDNIYKFEQKICNEETNIKLLQDACTSYDCLKKMEDAHSTCKSGRAQSGGKTQLTPMCPPPPLPPPCSSGSTCPPPTCVPICPTTCPPPSTPTCLPLCPTTCPPPTCPPPCSPCCPPAAAAPPPAYPPPASPPPASLPPPPPAPTCVKYPPYPKPTGEAVEGDKFNIGAELGQTTNGYAVKTLNFKSKGRACCDPNVPFPCWYPTNKDGEEEEEKGEKKKEYKKAITTCVIQEDGTIKLNIGGVPGNAKSPSDAK